MPPPIFLKADLAASPFPKGGNHGVAAFRKATGHDVSVGVRTPIGNGLPMLFDFLDEVGILK